MKQDGDNTNSAQQVGNSVSCASSRDEQEYYEKLGELQKKLRLKWRYERAYRLTRERVRQDVKAMDEDIATCRRLEADIKLLKLQREAHAKSSENYSKMLDAGVARIFQIRDDIPRIKMVAELVEEGASSEGAASRPSGSHIPRLAIHITSTRLKDLHLNDRSLISLIWQLVSFCFWNTRRELYPINMSVAWKAINRELGKQLRVVGKQIELDRKKLDKLKAKEIKQQKADIGRTFHNLTTLEGVKGELDECERWFVAILRKNPYPKSAALFRKYLNEIRELWDDGKAGCPRDLYEEIQEMFAALDEAAEAAGVSLDYEPEQR
ncbi:hypothetical protein BC567DRAFT_210398 [Phyllosticta citribraziliensis]